MASEPSERARELWREIFRLNAYEGKSFEECAQAIDRALLRERNAVLSKLDRVRKAAEAVEKEWDETFKCVCGRTGHTDTIDELMYAIRASTEPEGGANGR